MARTPASARRSASPASDFFGLFSGVTLKLNALHAFQVRSRGHASATSTSYSSFNSALPDHQTAGHFAFCGARSYHSFSSRQLGSRHHVVHIRFFCCSGISMRGPPHHFLASLWQKEVLMPRLMVCNSKNAPLPCSDRHPFCRVAQPKRLRRPALQHRSGSACHKQAIIAAATARFALVNLTSAAPTCLSSKGLTGKKSHSAGRWGPREQRASVCAGLP